MLRSILTLTCIAAAEAQVRAYQDVGSDVELGVAHAGGDIGLVAGVSRTAGKAARAFISHHSGTGMTGGEGAAGTPAAHGALEPFDYEGFSSKVDQASEDVLADNLEATREKLAQARAGVLEEAFGGATAGAATGSTGSTGSTGGAATGGAAPGVANAAKSEETKEDDALEKTIEHDEAAEQKTATAGATGASTGPASPEELVEKERAKAKGDPAPTGPTGMAKPQPAEDATGEDATGEDATGAEEAGDATGSETGGATGSATGGATGGGANAHWKWIHGSGHGGTLLRHAKQVQGRKQAGKVMSVL